MRVPACLRRILAASLCLLLFLSAAPAASAQENDSRAAESGLHVADGEELQAIVDGLIEELKLRPEDVSIGYCYTLTGESWTYNEDEWYYSASLYKVPLMMLLAEKEHNGELTQESKIKGITLAYAEESILVYSNNDYAHMMMNYLGSDRECREMYRQYATLSEEDYPDNFYDYSYFNVRFMTDVMQTLYYENERFPHIVENLKRAQPGHYFRREDSGEYEIAQKYGSLVDVSGVAFNHTSGIVFTPNPFILTVMTKNVPGVENVIYRFEQSLLDYTLQLDGRLEQARAEAAKAEQEALEAEQRRQAEEEERRRQEQEAAQAAASASPAPTQAPEAPEPESKTGPVLLLGGGAVLALALAALALTLKGRGRRRSDNPQQARRPEKRKRGGYTPRH